MKQRTKQRLSKLTSLFLTLMMLFSISVNAFALGPSEETVPEEDGIQVEVIFPEEVTDESVSEAEEEIMEEHWLQQYQNWALSQVGISTMALRGASPSLSYISWASGEANRLKFSNGGWLGTPLPKISLNGEVAFCGEWNGVEPSGSYEQTGTGDDPVIKQILANYDKSSKSNAHYAAAQVAIWARIMGTTVSSWGDCPAQSAYDEIRNGQSDTSNVKYNYISWSGGTQDLITYNIEEEPEDSDEPNPPAEEEYPPDEYRIEVNTETSTETEVRNRTSYEYSDAIGQITIRKHDQDGKSLDSALFDIDVAFTDGSHTTVQNWEVDNGARLFTWTHPKDNHDPATVTIREVKAPDGYEMDETPQTAVVAPTYTRVTKVETWTVTIVTETTSSTVIEIASGEVVAESSSSSSAETESDPQVQEHTDFIEGDRETTVTFVNNELPCSLTIYKHEKGNKEIALEGARFRIRYADPNVCAEVWTKTTDAKGEIYLPLPDDGTLIVEELEAPDGYVIGEITSHEVVVQKGEDKRIDISNDKKASIIVYKRDNQTGQLLAGAVIKATLLRSHTTPYESGTVYTQTTDESGRAIFENMIPGEYRIEETSPPQYYLPTDVVHTVNVYDGSHAAVEVEFRNDPWTGLTIRKVDAITGEGLAGAVFKLYEGTAAENTKFLGDFQTNQYGNIVVPELESEKYYTIVEAQAPYGYLLDKENSTQTIKIKPEALEENLTVIFRNLPKPKLLIEKIDADSGEKLEGAVFRVARRGSEEYVDVTTGKDGTVLLEGLEEDWYTVTEIRSPSGYVCDDTHHDIELIAGETAELVVKNRQKPNLVIEKIDSMTLQSLEGVVFEVSIKNGASLGQYSTDAEGRIVIECVEPNEIYLVKEVRALPGYLMDETVHEVTLSANESKTLKLQNTPEHPIIIQKKDAATGEPIPDTVFLVTKVDGSIVGEYRTGSNGMVTVSGEAVVPGWYRVQEIEANPAYIADSNPKLVELKYGEPAVVEFTNKARTGLQIRKTDEVTGEPIEGVAFYVEEISGREIGTFYTDEAGIINIPNQEEIWVRVREVKAAEGYKADPTPKTIQLKSGELNILEFRNQPYPTLKIVKVDAQTNQPLAGVKIRVYDKFQREVGTYTTNNLGQIILTGMDGGETLYVQEVETLPGYQLDKTVYEAKLAWGETTTVEISNKPLATLKILKVDAETKEPIYGAVFLLYDEKNNLIGEYTTDQNGLIEFNSELPEGKYKLKEIKCEGYVVDETIRTVEVKSGETTELVVENRPLRGQIQIVKKSADDNPITKDKAGTLLNGAVFEIYNEKLEVVDTITIEKGIATSKALHLGTYAIKEVSAPEYYLLNDKVFYAQLKVADDLVRFEVLNNSIIPDVSIEKHGNMEVLAGDNMSYEFSNIRNASNCALDEFYWHDALPKEVRLDRIVTGTWSERLSYSVSYCTNLDDDYTALAEDLSSTVSHTLDCSAETLRLKKGEYITDIRFDFGTVSPDFHEESSPMLFVTALADLADGFRIINRVDAGGRIGDEWIIAKDTWVTVVWAANKGELPKTGV